MNKSKLFIVMILFAFIIPLTGCANKYELNVEIAPEYAGSVIGAGNFEEGKEVTIKVEPEDGYKFNRWLENGEEISTEDNYRFEIESNREIVAEFVKEEYEVKVDVINMAPSKGEGGKVSGGGIYEHGQEVTVKADPEDGYVFESWMKDGGEISTNKTYKFAIEKDIELKANFGILITNDEDEVLFKQSDIIRHLEKEWETLTEGKDITLPGDVTLGPSSFTRDIDCNFSPNREAVAFILKGPYVSLMDFSVAGYFEEQSEEFTFTRLLEAYHSREKDSFIWSDTGEYFAYTVSSAKGSNILLLIDGLNGQNIRIDSEMLREKIYAKRQKELDEYGFSFSGLKWVKDAPMLYFTAETLYSEESKKFDCVFNLKTEKLKIE